MGGWTCHNVTCSNLTLIGTSAALKIIISYVDKPALSLQTLLFQSYSREPETNSLALLDEIESSKEQIKNLRDALLCSEEEKQDIQNHYQHHLKLMNDLKLEIENWKSKAIPYTIKNVSNTISHPKNVFLGGLFPDYAKKLSRCAIIRFLKNLTYLVCN